MERAELVAQALVFLVRVTDEDVPLDEALNALSALAEQFQSGAIVGGTLIDSSSATFDRVVYPSLLASPFSTLRHVPIGSPIFGTCAKAVRERKTISCSDTATEACFDVSWRSLYLGLGIHSVQSAPVFSFNGRPLGTFVVAIRQPHASFDTEMTGFGVYAMRTILQEIPLNNLLSLADMKRSAWAGAQSLPLSLCVLCPREEAFTLGGAAFCVPFHSEQLQWLLIFSITIHHPS